MINPVSPKLVLATASQPGAVALIQIHGPGTPQLLERLTGRSDWTPHRLRLCDFAGIDEGLAVLLDDGESEGEPGDESGGWAQVMPHGGPRVVTKIVDQLLDWGAVYESDAPAQAVYPEADSPIEADMLGAMARAASPAAVDLLAAQPALWRDYLVNNLGVPPIEEGDAARLPLNGEEILAQSAVLDRLITPPWVVVVGLPNVGKSTLTNAMLGRSASLVADLPGTTRDWVSGLAELDASPVHSPGSIVPDSSSNARNDGQWTMDNGRFSVAVHWTDTPGLRDEAKDADPIEREAIELAWSVLDRADVLIAMREADGGSWPNLDALPRMPDLYVVNKVDSLPEERAAALDPRNNSPRMPLPISAKHDHNLDALRQLIVERLGLAQLTPPPLWAFSPTLRRDLNDGGFDWRTYVSPRRRDP